METDIQIITVFFPKTIAKPLTLPLIKEDNVNSCYSYTKATREYFCAKKSAKKHIYLVEKFDQKSQSVLSQVHASSLQGYKLTTAKIQSN